MDQPQGCQHPPETSVDEQQQIEHQDAPEYHDQWHQLFSLSQKAEKRCLLRRLPHIFLPNTCATKTR